MILYLRVFVVIRKVITACISGFLVKKDTVGGSQTHQIVIKTHCLEKVHRYIRTYVALLFQQE